MSKRKCYSETVDADTFFAIENKILWIYEMPLRKRYIKFIPEKAFALDDDKLLIVEGPKAIRFRKRWSLRSVTRDVRLVFIVNNGEIAPHLKIHLV